jgi:hypothetical protein
VSESPFERKELQESTWNHRVRRAANPADRLAREARRCGPGAQDAAMDSTSLSSNPTRSTWGFSASRSKP